LTGQPFGLLSEQDVSDLAAAVRSVAGPGAVVCIDTLNAAAPGVDENSSSEMGKMINGAKRLQAAVSGLVVLVHHSGKDSAKGLRGHSSLFAACDFVIEVVRKGAKRDWRLSKSKDGADNIHHPFRLDVVNVGTHPEDGEAITSCVVEPEESAVDALRSVKLPAGGNQRVVYDALGELLRQVGIPGMAGAPPNCPCVQLERAIEKTRDLLVCEPHRKTERTRDALISLAKRGVLAMSDGWLWLT
jgi:hypothetical protein